MALYHSWITMLKLESDSGSVLISVLFVFDLSSVSAWKWPYNSSHIERQQVRVI